MDSLFNSIIHWTEGAYLLIFVGMLIEGNITMFAVGFLLNNPAINPFGLVFTALLGAYTEQFFWFWFGSQIKNSNSRFANWLIKKSNHFDDHFLHRPKTTLLLSKFIYGVHRAAIARAAVLEINIKTYLKHITPVMLLWFLVIGGIGYGLGQSYGLIQKYFKWAEFLLLGVVIFVFVLQRYVISGKLRKIWKRI